MAFSFQNSNARPFGAPNAPPNNSNSNSQVQAKTGPKLEDIQTEGIGFQAIAGEAKVQLLPTPWPSNNLPPPTSCLLSIASRRGLLAAAGPDMILVAYTEHVRKAFEASAVKSKIKPFEPQLSLPMPFRISQVTFSTDENFLVLSAEVGGGLAVYDVQSLLNGNQESSFQISTNSESIRALVPNPAVEKGELMAVVTTQGKLMVANLKQKDFVAGANGPILKENVSCVSWSKLGKQLVAGLGDGTAYQLTPEGVCKAEIPSPPTLSGSHHVSQIAWLENAVFLTAHTPSSFDTSQAPSSEFNLVTKQASTPQNPQPTTYVFQKVSEPVGPYGLNRSPPHHFILRLHTFPPNLHDVLIVSSSASTDIGLLTRSGTPLSKQKIVTNVFTYTEPSDDSRRAALPYGPDALSDTSPIGMALDLSSDRSVSKPIPMDDEIDKSDGPLPGLMVLNNEGVLASWWIVYSDSIRAKTSYPGLVSTQSNQQPTAQPAQQQSAFRSNTATSSGFGAPSFGSTSAFGADSSLGQKTSPWGTPSAATTTATSSFGAPSSAFGSASTFGASSGLGQKGSPWATAASSNNTTATNPTFGSPSFGTPSLPSALAGPAKPFGSATGSAQAAAPAFGQAATFGGTTLPGQKTSPWGTPSISKPTASVPTTGGFASFAGTKGGFAAAAAPEASGANPFAQKASSGGFASFSGGSTAFGQPEEKPKNIFGGSSQLPSDGPTAFGKPQEKPKNIFGGLDQPSPMATDSASTPSNSIFGGNGLFGNPNNLTGQAGINPFSQNKPGTLFGSGPAFKLESSFKGDGSAKDDLPKPSGESLFGPSFGSALSESQKPTTKDEPMGNGNAESTTPLATPTYATFGARDVAARPHESGGFKNSFGDAPQSPKPNKGLFSLAGSSTSAFPSATDTTPEASKPIGNPFSIVETPAKDKVPESVISSPKAEKESSKEEDRPNAPSTPDLDNSGPPSPPDFPSTAVAKENDASPSLPSAAEGDEFDAHETKSETYSLHSECDGDNEKGFSEEGSGEDVAKDLSPKSSSTASPQDSLNDRSAQDNPPSIHSSVRKPEQSSPRQRLFGEIPKYWPSQIHGEPVSSRSPSPVRPLAIIPDKFRPDVLRSVSFPWEGRINLDLAEAHTADAVERFRERVREEVHSKAKESEEAHAKRAQAKAEKEAKEAEEIQAMIDHDDNLAQKILSAEIIPTTVLDEFIAHQDYIGKSDRTSIPALVETVYRDINSMVDTLGMNARVLKAFVMGHSQGHENSSRTKEDLEKDDDGWVLVEIESLGSIIEHDLTDELKNNCIQDISATLQECSALESGARELRDNLADIKKIYLDKRDPDLREADLAAPLSKEQAHLQSDVREKFQDFQDLMIKAEENLSLLKAKLISRGGKAGGAGNGVPTIDAVVKTIAKMTAIAEKKSEEVDVLEEELRQMNLGSSSAPGSREGSPFAASIPGLSPLRASFSTRSPLRSSVPNGHGSPSGGSGSATPRAAKPSPQRTSHGSVVPRSSRGPMARSARASALVESPARRTIDDVPDEAMQRAAAKVARRRAVAKQLRVALDRVAPRVVGMDED